MKTIPLGRSGKVALVDDDVYEHVKRLRWNHEFNGRGERTFTYRTCSRARLDGRRGSERYRCRPGPRRRYLHQLVRPGCRFVDHKNGDGLNNLRTNLRCISTAKNIQNSRLRLDNTSGFKGVAYRPDRGRYEVSLQVEGKRKFLGYHDTAVDAAKARDRGTRIWFGEFGRLNFPEIGERGLDGEIRTK